MVERTHWRNSPTLTAPKSKIVIDGCNEIDSKNVVARQLIMIDECAVVDVGFELIHQRPIDSGVDGTLLLDVAVPRTERVLHEYAEDLSDAEVRQVKKVFRLSRPHRVEYRLNAVSGLLGVQGARQVVPRRYIRIEKQIHLGKPLERNQAPLSLSIS